MASLTDKITETFNGQNPTSTTVSNARSLGGTTLTCNSLAGWPTITAVHFATYRKDSTGAKVAGSQTDWKGIVSGSSINSLTRQGGASDGGNGVGDIVEMMPTYSWANDLAKSLENILNNNGTFKSNLTIPSPTLTTPTSNSPTLNSPTFGGTPAANTLDASVLKDGTVKPQQMLGIDVFGVGSAIVGSAPSAGTGQFYIQAGSTVGVFALNAYDFTFPTAFPNGVLSVVATDGDNTAGASVSLGQNNITASGVRFQGTNGTRRIDWIAIGF